ncbi:hypothetical protein BofuT4_P019680.1 [Botrytis cinerea T4]|uniref:Uncharacterized protein n=1 Tax=Botryotinia fuckeliana (strain T4) TaxID=999810 RepID=G2YIX5_BOTF4|nr:hypothetical protein BofuT4_P019680.1 [Botrytis cinerea T4]
MSQFEFPRVGSAYLDKLPGLKGKQSKCSIERNRKYDTGDLTITLQKPAYLTSQTRSIYWTAGKSTAHGNGMNWYSEEKNTKSRSISGRPEEKEPTLKSQIAAPSFRFEVSSTHVPSSHSPPEEDSIMQEKYPHLFSNTISAPANPHSKND